MARHRDVRIRTETEHIVDATSGEFDIAENLVVILRFVVTHVGSWNVSPCSMDARVKPPPQVYTSDI